MFKRIETPCAVCGGSGWVVTGLPNDPGGREVPCREDNCNNGIVYVNEFVGEDDEE